MTLDPDHLAALDAAATLEPVAWMYEQNGCFPEVRMHRLRDSYGRNWTETPLYTSDQIIAMARENERLRMSVAEEWCAYMDAEVSRAPEPIKQLGEYLAGLLHEDQWKVAERYLNAAALAENARAALENRDD